VSAQKSEPISGETNSVGATPAAPETSVASAPVTASAAEVGAARLAPEQEQTSPKADAPKVEAPKVEGSKPQAPRSPGNVLIMSPGDRSRDGESAGPKAEAGQGRASGKRRVAAMAAVVALATVAGAIGGALATAGLGHFVVASDAATPKDSGFEASVARIDAEILALKASVEQTARIAASQFNKTGDRLDKVENALAEPAARTAKLSEAVDKLRATPAAAPATVAAAPVAAKDITGSVTPPAVATAAATPAPAAPPKPEVARLPVVEGWRLRDVGHGGAVIEGRRGMYEVYAGDPIPGLGRVDAIRKQDGRWVVVTSKGLIVAR
jgi:hypothetical protein